MPTPDTYFTDLKRDFQELGLRHDNVIWPVEYGDLYAMVEPTAYIGDEECEALSCPPEPYQLVTTALVAQILDLMRQGVQFSTPEFDDYAEICCQKAEYRLAEHLSHEEVADPTYGSPIIVTGSSPTSGEPQPVGIIKLYGEPTCYGLETDIKNGIVEGAFSQPQVDFCLGTVPSSTAAWHIPVEDVGPMLPIRFSFFPIPKIYRQDLAANPKEERALLLSHEQIKRRARRLLRTAMLINPNAHPSNEISFSIRPAAKNETPISMQRETGKLVLARSRVG